MNDGYSPDRHCESFYKNTSERDDSGRYIVRLPKQPDFDEKCGISRPQAIRRFEFLERRLERDPALREAYQDFMKKYLALGHMSPISTECDDTAAYYLPHHPVFKASSITTKMGVVFDDSSKMSTGFSLNETLQDGPIVQDELIDIILRFCKICQQLSELLSKGGFELRNIKLFRRTKWFTSRPYRYTVITAVCAWKPELDVLCFESTAIMETANLTMRSILSNITRMFDPLGLAPVIIRAKLLMLEL